MNAPSVVWVYPRVCGGTDDRQQDAQQEMGLSPRVRGNLCAVPSGLTASRSIPACAGEPPARYRAHPATPVYPRVCGGTSSRWKWTPGGRGLSPRVRGNLARRMAQAVLCWSIPACAGEPPGQSSGGWLAAVYPRVCGGTASPTWPAALSPGLSPRVRGNHLANPAAACCGRSIPACAGEPLSLSGSLALAEVYPRVCGGTRLRPGRPAPRSGLSPRVRGNLYHDIWGKPESGSIPACAGEPIRPTRLGPRKSVYPRVCGGTA